MHVYIIPQTNPFIQPSIKTNEYRCIGKLKMYIPLLNPARNPRWNNTVLNIIQNHSSRTWKTLSSLIASAHRSSAHISLNDASTSSTVSRKRPARILYIYTAPPLHPKRLLFTPLCSQAYIHSTAWPLSPRWNRELRANTCENATTIAFAHTTLSPSDEDKGKKEKEGDTRSSLQAYSLYIRRWHCLPVGSRRTSGFSMRRDDEIISLDVFRVLYCDVRRADIRDVWGCTCIAYVLKDLWNVDSLYFRGV